MKKLMGWRLGLVYFENYKDPLDEVLSKRLESF
jgi:hypothetical protein